MTLHQAYSFMHGDGHRCCVPAYPPLLFHRPPLSNNGSDDEYSVSSGSQDILGDPYDDPNVLPASSNAHDSLPHPTDSTEASPDISGAYRMGALISTLTQPPDIQQLDNDAPDVLSRTDHSNLAEVVRAGDEITSHDDDKEDDGAGVETVEEDEEDAAEQTDEGDEDSEEEEEDEEEGEEYQIHNDETLPTAPPGARRRISQTTSNPTLPFPSHEETEGHLRTILITIPQDSPISLDSLTDEPNFPRTSDTIIAAIWSSPHKRLTLQEIYEAVKKRFPHWDTTRKGKWRDNIRHNLTLKSMFVKVKREQNEPGFGNGWMININMGEGHTRERSKRRKKNGKRTNRSKSKSRGGRQALILQDPDDVFVDESDPSMSTSSSGSTRSQRAVISSSQIVVSRRQAARAISLIESREIQRVPSGNSPAAGVTRPSNTPFISTSIRSTRPLPNPYRYFTPSTNPGVNLYPPTRPFQERGSFREFPYTGTPSMRWDNSDVPQMHPLPPHTDNPSLRWDTTNDGGNVTVRNFPSSRAGYQQIQQIPTRGRSMISIRGRGTRAQMLSRGRGQGGQPLPVPSAPRRGVWVPGANIDRSDLSPVLAPQNLGRLLSAQGRVRVAVTSVIAHNIDNSRGDRGRGRVPDNTVSQRQTRSQTRASLASLESQAHAGGARGDDGDDGEDEDKDGSSDEETEADEDSNDKYAH